MLKNALERLHGSKWRGFRGTAGPTGEEFFSNLVSVDARTPRGAFVLRPLVQGRAKGRKHVLIMPPPPAPAGASCFCCCNFRRRTRGLEHETAGNTQASAACTWNLVAYGLAWHDTILYRDFDRDPRRKHCWFGTTMYVLQVRNGQKEVPSLCSPTPSSAGPPR